MSARAIGSGSLGNASTRCATRCLRWFVHLATWPITKRHIKVDRPTTFGSPGERRGAPVATIRATRRESSGDAALESGETHDAHAE
jgi:hypothetical protein